MRFSQTDCTRKFLIDDLKSLMGLWSNNVLSHLT